MGADVKMALKNHQTVNIESHKTRVMAFLQSYSNKREPLYKKGG
jgi:hypothetical protein